MALEMEKETHGMASAGGYDDPDDKKDKIPTIHPEDMVSDSDEEVEEPQDVDTESDDETLAEAISKMTLSEKKDLREHFADRKERFETKEKMVRMAIKKHEKAIRNEGKADKEKEKKMTKQAKEREEREKMITVNVRRGDRNFAVAIRADRGIGSLRRRFFEMAGVKKTDQAEFRFTFNGINLFEVYPSGRKTLRELGIVDGSVVDASIRGAGGARFNLMKNHLKTADEAKKDLKSKVKTTFAIEKIDEQVVFPETFNTFLNETRQSVEEVKLLQSRINFPVIEVALKQLPVEKLNLLVETLEYGDGKRKGTSEEKLSKALGLVFPKLTCLSQCIKAIEVLSSELIVELFNLYIDAYGNYVNGVMQYNNARFLSDVKKEILKREIASNGDGVSDAVNAPAGCLIV